MTHWSTPPDGLRFDPDSAKSIELQADDEYSGVRVRITAYLGSAEIRAQVDVAFGEKLMDDPVEMELPALLDCPWPRLRTYSADASIAEKLQAMVRFGSTNDRMKDYLDVYTLCCDGEEVLVIEPGRKFWDNAASLSGGRPIVCRSPKHICRPADEVARTRNRPGLDPPARIP